MYSIVMLGVVMLSVVMLSVIMLSVVAPYNDPFINLGGFGYLAWVFVICRHTFERMSQPFYFSSLTQTAKQLIHF